MMTSYYNTDYYVPELIPLYFTIRGDRAINLWTAQYELHCTIADPPKGPHTRRTKPMMGK